MVYTCSYSFLGFFIYLFFCANIFYLNTELVVEIFKMWHDVIALTFISAYRKYVFFLALSDELFFCILTKSLILEHIGLVVRMSIFDTKG